MLGFGSLGELPLGTSPYPATPVSDSPLVLTALFQYLTLVLPQGIVIVQGQDNRVSDPPAITYIVMWEISRTRLATNTDVYQDCKFQGSIAGDILTVPLVELGTIEDNVQIFGVGVLPGTTIVSGISGGGGPGTYLLNNSQIVSARTLSAGTGNLTGEFEVIVQIDVHEPNNPPTPPPAGIPGAADIATMITTALRDTYACDYYEENYPGVSPLYADDAKQIPFVNAQEQYENRWIIEAHFEINPTLVVPQQFADQVVVTPLSVKALYP